MRLCGFHIVALVFVLWLPNAPVCLAASGRGKKEKKAKTASRASRRTSPTPVHVSDKDEGDPFGFEGATAQPGPEPRTSTGKKGSGVRSTVEKKLAELRHEIAALEEELDFVRGRLAATLSGYPGEVQTPTPSCTSPSESAGGATRKQKCPGGRAPAAALSAPSLEHLRGDKDREAGADSGFPGAAAADNDTPTSDSEGTDTASLPSTAEEGYQAPAFPTYYQAGLALVAGGWKPEAGALAPSSTGRHSRSRVFLLKRSTTIVEDLVDTLFTLLGVYRVRGGADFNEVRRLVRSAWTTHSAFKVTDRELWDDEAEAALNFGRSLLHAVDTRNALVMSGTVPPVAQFSQVARTRPARCVQAAERALRMIMRKALPAYEACLQSVGGPLEARRQALSKLNAAVLQMQESKGRHIQCWYFYAEFLCMWLLVKQAKLQAEVAYDETVSTAEH